GDGISGSAHLLVGFFGGGIDRDALRDGGGDPVIGGDVADPEEFHVLLGSHRVGYTFTDDTVPVYCNLDFIRHADCPSRKTWFGPMVVWLCFSSGVVGECPCSELVEHLLHLGDLGLLIFNDLLSQSDGLRVLLASAPTMRLVDTPLPQAGAWFQTIPPTAQVDYSAGSISLSVTHL